MKFIFISAFLIVNLVVSSLTFAEKICIKSTLRSGKIVQTIKTVASSAKCAKGFSQIVDTALLSGPAGAQGLTGPQGPAGATGASNPNAETLDGVDSTGFMMYGSVIPGGVTIRGVFGVFSQDRDVSQSFSTTARTFVSLPAEAPVALTDANVNFRSGFPFDSDTACTGTTSNPTAPPGKVCLYPVTTVGTISSAFGRGSFSLGEAAKFGFEVEVTQASATGVNGPYVSGSWAYTAPFPS